MKINVFATRSHYAEHIEAIWRHLPEDIRGTLYVDPHPPARFERSHGPDDIYMVAGYSDLAHIKHHRVVFVEHGAGQRYCLDGRTRVLTDDLRWQALSEVQVGDKLQAFDEEPAAGKSQRAWRPAEIVAKENLTRPCYELSFSDGTTIVASSDHMWLTRDRRMFEWSTTENLQPASSHPRRSSKVVRLLDTWEEDQTRGAGYLAAAFDGEGCLNQTPRRDGVRRLTLAFSQRSNAMLDCVLSELDKRSFRYRASCYSSGTNRDVASVTIQGGTRETFRFLGSIRPLRLLENFIPREGTQIRGKPIELIEKRFVGDHPVVAVETTTGTFVAEGLASHNCDLREQDRPYYGGPYPDNVIAYIGPRQELVDAVGLPGHAAGSPVCDPYELFGEDHAAVISFHWKGTRICPEAGSALAHYADKLPRIINLLRSKGWTVYGHRHPRLTQPPGLWQRLGVEELNVQEVRQKCSLLIMDNSSLQAEMAYLARQNIFLNAPTYRRDVNHGLRFWDYPGPHADDPDELCDIINSITDHLPGGYPSKIAELAYDAPISRGFDGVRAAAWMMAHLPV